MQMDSRPHIRQLPPEVISQIAAGEVVERPAAAIKELVENSLDAGATSITVDIRDGGVTSFRVADNGSGIRPEDIKLAFASHATSKIRTADELYGVRSLGFRGEALSSISAVSRVQCLTRTKNRESGISVRNEGGQMMEIIDAACPEGTVFTVKDLFYNAPVRRKFLKKPATETAAVSELMARMILSHPAVSFRFVADGKTLYFSAGDGQLKSAVMSVYGIDTLKLLTPVSGHMNGVELSGFVGTGDAARGNRNHQHFFLNGRSMKSALLSGAVENACRQRVTIGRFPMCVLHLDMPYDKADVNVHPNKWEVRFQDEQGVKQAVETVVLEALQKTDSVIAPPPLFLDTQTQPAAQVLVTDAAPAIAQTAAAAPVPPPVKPIELPPVRAQAPLCEPAIPAARAAVPVPPPIPQPPRPVTPKAAVIPAAPKQEPPVIRPPEQMVSRTVEKAFSGTVPLRLVGVAFNTYILLEYGDELLICDQHAVHERILYEKLMRRTETEPVSQTLLAPLAVKLSRTEYAAYEENTEILERAGFDLTPFGDDTVQLRGVPVILGEPRAEKCLLETLDELASGGNPDAIDRTSRVIQMACKHAVKGGERLSDSAVLSLVRDILEKRLPLTCPHGRPVMVTLSHTDMDKRFRRIQN